MLGGHKVIFEVIPLSPGLKEYKRKAKYNT